MSEHVLETKVRVFKRSIIIQALIDNRFNQCRAARELGIHRNTLSRNLDELDINLPELKRCSRENCTI